ncbi:hypothetical protein [Roseibium algae]|uniref:WYL domain-containing protein n=1 Tax=Roseibium algae TaxID=3123038 RepID=A0ABU8TRI2_9HYPH
MSRDKKGDFTGSHQIFQTEKPNTYKVIYCEQNYWVRIHTIAWSQVESENQRTIQIEYNFGKGWRPICLNPERQVTLLDLGISLEPRRVLESSDKTLKANIRYEAFKDAQKEKAN